MSDGEPVRKGSVQELAEMFGGAAITRSPPLTPATHAEARATTEPNPKPELEPQPELEPGAALPSPSEQRNAMQRCLGGTSPSSTPMKAGETWYVVSQQWWQCWCAHVGWLAPTDHASSGTASVSNTQIGPPPGPIDASDVLERVALTSVAGFSAGARAGVAQQEALTLRRTAGAGEELELLPASAWALLLEWHGVLNQAHVLPRTVLQAADGPRLELHPLRFDLNIFVSVAADETRTGDHEDDASSPGAPAFPSGLVGPNSASEPAPDFNRKVLGRGLALVSAGATAPMLLRHASRAILDQVKLRGARPQSLQPFAMQQQAQARVDAGILQFDLDLESDVEVSAAVDHGDDSTPRHHRLWLRSSDDSTWQECARSSPPPTGAAIAAASPAVAAAFKGRCEFTESSGLLNVDGMQMLVLLQPAAAGTDASYSVPASGSSSNIDNAAAAGGSTMDITDGPGIASDWRVALDVGATLDACDYVGDWFESRIVECVEGPRARLQQNETQPKGKLKYPKLCLRKDDLEGADDDVAGSGGDAPTPRAIKVHFLGWNSSFDEWISAYDEHRVYPPYKSGHVKNWRQQLRVNEWVDIGVINQQTQKKKWYKARVKKIDRQHNGTNEKQPKLAVDSAKGTPSQIDTTVAPTAVPEPRKDSKPLGTWAARLAPDKATKVAAEVTTAATAAASAAVAQATVAATTTAAVVTDMPPGRIYIEYDPNQKAGLRTSYVSSYTLQTYQKKWVRLYSDDVCPLHTHTKKPQGSATQSTALVSGRRGTPPAVGAVGLANLGNTCFMNSMIQCLASIDEFRDYFIPPQYAPPPCMDPATIAGAATASMAAAESSAISVVEGDPAFAADINRENILGTGGALAEEWAKLMQALHNAGPDAVNPGRGNPGAYLSVEPRAFKTELGKKAAQFQGYQQQDSQEFLTYVLDTLHEDLNLVTQKPMTESVEGIGRPDDEVARESWDTYLLRHDSIVVDKMQFQLRSHLTCPSCKNESLKFDEASILSLPLPHVTTKEIFVAVHFIDVQALGGKALLLKVEIPKTGTGRDLAAAIVQLLENDAESTQGSTQYPRLTTSRLYIAAVGTATHRVENVVWNPAPAAASNLNAYSTYSSASNSSAAAKKDPLAVKCEQLGQLPRANQIVHAYELPPSASSQVKGAADAKIETEAEAEAEAEPVELEILVVPGKQGWRAAPWHHVDTEIIEVRESSDGSDAGGKGCNDGDDDPGSEGPGSEGQFKDIPGNVPLDPHNPAPIRLRMRMHPSAHLGTLQNFVRQQLGPLPQEVRFVYDGKEVEDMDVPLTSDTIGVPRAGLQVNCVIRQPTDWKSQPLQPALIQGRDAARQVVVMMSKERPSRYNAAQMDYDLQGDPWILAVGGGGREITHSELHERIFAHYECMLKPDVAAAIKNGQRQPPYKVRVASNIGRTPYSAEFPYIKLAKARAAEAAAGTTNTAGSTVPAASKNYHNYNQPPPLLPDDESLVLPVLWQPDSATIRIDWTEEALNDAAEDNWIKGLQGTVDNFEKHPSALGEGGAAGGDGLTLQRCLTAFGEPEVLSEADEWYCPKCKNHVQATKRLSIWNAPKYLAIQLKRFHFQQRMGYSTSYSYGNYGNGGAKSQPSFAREKIETHVDFPLDGLDLAEYVLSPHARCPGGRHGAGYPQGGPKPGLLYDCVAVSNHMGGLGGGHYTAYARRDGRWFNFNDAQVTEVADTSKIVGTAAYVLFYKRRD